jgi:hypothetical protein
MEAVSAVVRVGTGARSEVLDLRAPPLLGEMAALLLDAALLSARAELQAPGVYGVEVEGDPRAPRVVVRHLAGPGQTVVTARVTRDGPEAMHVHSVRVSPAEGGEQAAERAHKALAEAAAAASRAMPVGSERAIEVVLDG